MLTTRTTLWLVIAALMLCGTALSTLYLLRCTDIECALVRIDRAPDLRRRQGVAVRMAKSVNREYATRYFLSNPIDTPAKKHLVMALYHVGEARLEPAVMAIALEWDTDTNRGSEEGHWAVFVLGRHGIDEYERRHQPSPAEP